MSGAQAAVDELRNRILAVDNVLPNLAEAQARPGWTKPEDCTQALLDAGSGSVALKLG